MSEFYARCIFCYQKEVLPLLPAVQNPKNTRLVAAFGAGVVCALILPKAFFCFVGASLLLAVGIHLSQNQHSKEC